MAARRALRELAWLVVSILLGREGVSVPARAQRASLVDPNRQLQACVDSDPIQCPLWAERGDCGSNPEWMKANCAASCKECTAAGAAGDVPVAAQSVDQCSLWAERGECFSNQRFMCVQCSSSCLTQCAGFSSTSSNSQPVGLSLPTVAMWVVGGFLLLKFGKRAVR